MTSPEQTQVPSELSHVPLASLVESAVVLRHGINDILKQAEEEAAPMAAQLAKAEAELRRRALQNGESIVGNGLSVRYTRSGSTVRWNDDGLMGAISMLSAEQRSFLLNFRSETPRAAGTQLVYDKSND